jgi:hypothetical protein
MKLIRTFVAVVALATLSFGCATQQSIRAKPLPPALGKVEDLSSYQTATVLPFSLPSNCKYPGAGSQFSANLANRLQRDFGPLFKEVRTSPALGQPDELIVTGNFKTYEPGSRQARMMCIGCGVASLKGNLVLRDGATQRELLIAPIDKLWAWGGILGGAKGIEEMTEESAASAAVTVAIHKGWRSHP